MSMLNTLATQSRPLSPLGLAVSCVLMRYKDINMVMSV